MGAMNGVDNFAELIEGLRATVRMRLRREWHAHSMDSMDVINSAFRRALPALQRALPPGLDWGEYIRENPAYVFGLMYKAIDEVLIDHGRKRKRAKRPPPNRRVVLDQIELANVAWTNKESPEIVEALAEVLERWDTAHPNWAVLVRHYSYGGCTLKEAAKLMGISESTAGRYWKEALFCLNVEIRQILNEDDPASREDGDGVEPGQSAPARL
jgi:RNA polymerase sigma factor (sigma-70 family)